FVCDTSELLHSKLTASERVVIEGSQGFGLSLLDGGFWPKATSRTTTAAGALTEAGLSPLDVDDVTLVIRSFPIRVAGDSGFLPNEVTWEYVASLTGRHAEDIQEYTTVTKKLRRVGMFDPAIVRAAIFANRPNRIVLNHVDYVGFAQSLGDTESHASKFLAQVEQTIGQPIASVGFDELGILDTAGELHDG
ncbi:MAG: adenylosuccinate synthetase, partial [Bdellovibrionales bacterium]|nr:adenylosuccinate synthetase [Bdellovibrionales bacterium]